MPNEKNIIPNSERTPEERREIARAGGIASGISRRRKRTLKDAADLFLSLPVSDKKQRDKLEKRNLDPDDVDNQMAIIVGLWERAVKGDSKAAKILIDLINEGEKEQNENGMLADLIDGLKDDD